MAKWIKVVTSRSKVNFGVFVIIIGILGMLSGMYVGLFLPALIIGVIVMFIGVLIRNSGMSVVKEDSL